MAVQNVRFAKPVRSSSFKKPWVEEIWLHCWDTKGPDCTKAKGLWKRRPFRHPQSKTFWIALMTGQKGNHSGRLARRKHGNCHGAWLRRSRCLCTANLPKSHRLQSAKTLRDRFSPSVSLALWKSRAAGMPVFQGFWLWSMTGGRELLIWHQQLARELRGSSSSTGSHPEVGQGQSLLWNGRCTKPSGRASCLLAAMQRQMRRRPFAFWQAKRLLPQLPRHSVCSQTSKPGWGTTLMQWADSLWNGMWMRPLERPTRSTSGARLR